MFLLSHLQHYTIFHPHNIPDYAKQNNSIGQCKKSNIPLAHGSQAMQATATHVILLQRNCRFLSYFLHSQKLFNIVSLIRGNYTIPNRRQSTRRHKYQKFQKVPTIALLSGFAEPKYAPARTAGVHCPDHGRAQTSGRGLSALIPAGSTGRQTARFASRHQFSGQVAPRHRREIRYPDAVEALPDHVHPRLLRHLPVPAALLESVDVPEVEHLPHVVRELH